MDQSVIVLVVIKDLSSKVSGRSEPLKKKAIGGAKWQSTNFFCMQGTGKPKRN